MTVADLLERLHDLPPHLPIDGVSGLDIVTCAERPALIYHAEDDSVELTDVGQALVLRRVTTYDAVMDDKAIWLHFNSPHRKEQAEHALRLLRLSLPS